ncbi:MAG: DNA polymerase III subunit delta [Candidatus Aegiribacteria sp.]|nr:DNA polymerase III subunit delta [Candidatus Aegiribacteria sp.]
MKIRKYNEMDKIANNASEGAVLVAAGPDLYQSGRLQSTVVKRFRKAMDYEILRFEADELSEGDLKRHLLENSLFSIGKLIVISNTHKLVKASGSELLHAINEGLSDSALFLSSEKVPRESAILRKLEKAVPVYICYEPFDGDMPGWAKRLASEEDIRLTRDTVQLLIEYSGRNLRRLSDAVTKLALYHGSGAEIDRNGMIEVISGKGGKDIFHLGDMIFGNRRGEAVGAAWSLLQYGEEPVGMIAYLFSLWQKVIGAMEIVEAGGGSQEVSAATGARYPLLDKLMKFTRTACKVDTAVAAEAFAEADYGVKTGVDHLLVFSRLIFTLTSGRL